MLCAPLLEICSDKLAMQACVLCSFVRCGSSNQIEIEKKNKKKNKNMLKWFTHSLSNKKQYIQYDKTSRTNCLNTKFGVPQGSILDPLLLLLYINNLHQASKIIKPIMFEDDTNFFYSQMKIKTLFDTVNKELNRLKLN